jgi:hypothetical protein
MTEHAHESVPARPPPARRDLAAELDAARGGGAPLPPPARAELEQGLGADFAAVRLHHGARADALATALGATAFTAGADVFLHRSAPHPATPAGRRLLTHELVHVVQQRAGPVDGRPGPGGLRVSDPQDRHERAAADVAGRVAAGDAVDLGAGVAPARQASGAVVQRQAPSPAAAPAPSVEQRLEELESRQAVSDVRQASSDQDDRWRGTFGARFSSCTQAILRVSGGLSASQAGFHRAQVEQAEFDNLATQLFLAAASVGLAYGFEPLLSSALGRMGKTAEQIKEIVERWENPAVQASGTLSNLVPATIANLAERATPAATGAPSGDPFAHLTGNLEAIEHHRQQMEEAFSARASARAGATDEQVLAFDPAAQEQIYSALYGQLLAASGGIEDLKSADQVAQILARHLWAGWLKQHGAVAIGDALYPLMHAPTPRDPESSFRAAERYSIGGSGAYIAAELNAVGVSQLAGVTLSEHWYGIDPPWLNIPYKLLTWAWSYRESIDEPAGIPDPTTVPMPG